MVGEFILLDTNILIYLLQGNQKLAQMLSDTQIVVSVISEMEVQCLKMTDEALQKVKKLLSQCSIIKLNPTIKEGAIEIVKQGKLKLPDEIIASTAFYLELPVFTADKQFERLDNCDIILFEPEPWD
jgi:hypothetical protein